MNEYSLNGREVSVIRMHTTIHVNGFGQSNQTISTLDKQDKFGKSVTMIKVEDGVFLKFTSGQQLLVPLNNLQSVEFVKA